MKTLKLLFIIFISLTTSVKADLNINDQLEEGGKLIFIRHAYAPGSGDPANFNLNDCSTQRNLNKEGIKQSVNIGQFFTKDDIKIDKVLSSEWCRCKDTAKFAFNKYSTFDALNSFYDPRFKNNKNKQVHDLKNYINNWKSKKNLVLITHFVVISEVLKVGADSGEIIISDKEFNIIGRY